MNIPRLIRQEIKYRKLNFLFGLLAIMAAVSLFVAFFLSGQASKRETVRLMRDIGFNLRVIPAETDMEKFWVNGYSEYTLPEQYVNDLAVYPGISYNHLTATLQKKILWRNHDIILTGMAPEVIPPGKRSTQMTFSIEPGTAYIGFELARNFNLIQGNTIEINNRPLKIARCLSETGSQDDIHIFVHLKDAQAIMNLENRINEIKALQCLCSGIYDQQYSLDQLRTQLKAALPGTKVILMRSIASARQNQRYMAERYFSFVFPLIVLAVMAWIGVLAFLNVRDRRQEIGIMRAVGFSSGKIAFLFLGKSLVMGMIAATFGYGIGTALAVIVGPQIFKITAQSIRPSVELLGLAFLGASLVSAAGVCIPTLIAIYQDPAQTLREN